MYNINSLIDDLHREHLLGRSTDPFTFDLMWKCPSSMLLVHISNVHDIKTWVLIDRTGLQYYKVTVLRSQWNYHYMLKASFRNSRLTIDYIKKLL